MSEENHNPLLSAESESEKKIYKTVEEAHQARIDERDGIRPRVKPEKPVFDTVDEAMDYERQLRAERMETEKAVNEFNENPPEHITAVNELARDAIENQKSQWTPEDIKQFHTISNNEQYLQSQINTHNEAIQRLQSIKNSDPAEAAALQADIDRNQKRLELLINEHDQNKRQIQLGLNKRAYDEADQSLIKLAPELKDKSERKKLRGWLINQGFKSSDVDSVMDPRSIALAYKAYQAEKQVNPTRGKVAVFKRKQSKQVSKAQKEANTALKQLKESGSLDDALVYLQAKRKARA